MKHEHLSDVKRALLEKRLRSAAMSKTSSTRAAIPRRDKTQHPLASFAQERIWFMQQLNADSTAYNMHQAFRLRGELNTDALEHAVNTVAQKHASLRTTFEEFDHALMQRIEPTNIIKINQFDLSQKMREEREVEWRQIAVDEARFRFDLTHLPLLRVSLIKLGEKEYILLLTIHHIVSDEWSNDLFWREVSAEYRSQSPEVSREIDYVDYAVWQREEMKGERLSKQLAFWKEKLGGELPLLQLPLDRPRPTAQSFRGTFRARTFETVVLDRLKSLAQANGTTLYNILLAAYFGFLFRYTGQSDLVVGTPVTNRSLPETEEMIGFFLNTLALRIDIDGAMRFVDLLHRVKSETQLALENQDAPFEKVVDEVQPKRDLSHNPIFQTMFVLNQDASSAIRLPNIDVETMWIDGGASKFDLTFFAGETKGKLDIAAEFATDLFDVETIERMLENFGVFLGAIAASPHVTIDSLPIMTEHERRQTLIEWNDTQKDFPSDALIHELIEAQAMANPNAPAVIFNEQQLSYGGLNERANEIASALGRAGVTHNTPVVLCVERSMDMIIGILGILKAGGAYVPIDPSYPQERIAFVLEDTQSPIILTQKHLAPRMPKTNAKIIALDDAPKSIDTSPTSIAHRSDTLAYIIYTSGSTGKPKGVMISHRNLVASTTARFSFYESQPKRFLLLSSFAFDSSVVGIFWALCSGGALVLPKQDEEKDALAILELIEKHGVTHTLCLPSLYRVLISFAEQKQLDSLSVVIVAGEACASDLVKLHYARVPKAKLFNEYGPTEGTVWSTACELTLQNSEHGAPIGKPIPNATNYILDSNLKPVPIGVVGELFIGGDGISRGYWNREALTSERFFEIKDWAFSNSAKGCYVYRTGDLARYRADGTIEYLGRGDQQIKIRGHRVELEEIESALREINLIEDVVVIAKTSARITDEQLSEMLSEMPSDKVEKLLEEISAMTS